MQTIFDGKREAEKIASFLEESEVLLGKSLVIIQADGRKEESTYVRLKREMGERLGVLVTVLFAENGDETEELVRDCNEDETVDGILVQLPIVGADKEKTEHILCSISEDKDVDGLNPKSSFVPAVVKGVERVMEIFEIDKKQEVAVVGALGMVGHRTKKRLESLGYKVRGFDKGDSLEDLQKYELIISATGTEGLIKAEMVKEGFAGIDLGYPRGDFSPEAVAKAGKMSPVPGGVGPMTVVCLFENLTDR